MPPALAQLFARHWPVGPREVFAAWAERAALVGLARGEVGDVNAAAFDAGCRRPDGPYSRGEVDLVIDGIEGQARRRRGRYRLAIEPGQPPAIVAEPSSLAWAGLDSSDERKFRTILTRVSSCRRVSRPPGARASSSIGCGPSPVRGLKAFGKFGAKPSTSPIRIMGSLHTVAAD